MEYKLRKSAHTFNIVPGVVADLLVSTSKFCDAGYVTIFDKDEVNIYNVETTTITASKKPILKGLSDRISTLWRILLVKQARGSDVGQVTNQVPGAQATSQTPTNIDSLWHHPTQEVIQNVYQLKTKPEVLRYLHVEAGFPTGLTWFPAVSAGNYNSWPWLSPKWCVPTSPNPRRRRRATRNPPPKANNQPKLG